MATYTVYFLDERKVIVSFDFVECADDLEVWGRVPALLKFRTDSRNVEIYEGARRVRAPLDHEIDVLDEDETIPAPAE
jgi:hypothetical protein